MTASSADTAEIPMVGSVTVGGAVRPLSVERPLVLIDAPSIVPELNEVPSVTPLRRVDRRTERLQARRVQRRWALGSLGILASTAGATVAVLVVLH
jgi:hypothetical protein